MARRGTWATRFGIYLAAIGSAFGLGGLWRFPYVVADNGGGAFVILYFFLMVMMGVPLLIGELMIGKLARRGVLAGQKQLTARAQSLGVEPRRRPLLWIMPSLAIVTLISAVAILGYYSVISGWVLHFLAQFIRMLFSSEYPLSVGASLDELLNSGALQVALSTVHLFIVSFIVAKGVEDGIEKWVGFVMPIFVAILSVLVFKSLSMSSSFDALRFFLYPDFSKLSISSLGAAVGQLCFTLSVGFGTMVTFGSYLREESLVPNAGFRVAALDSATALVAGFLVFPLVMGTGHSIDSPGPELLFKAVPGFLLKFEGGVIFGIFFFLCLYLAALGASLSLIETLVANICENTQMKRGRATVFASMAAFVASLVPALSSSVFSQIKVGGHSLFELVDGFFINWVVPIVALIFSQIVVYELNKKNVRDEFLALKGPSGEILYSHWLFLMKWVVPPVILLALVLAAKSLF